MAGKRIAKAKMGDVFEVKLEDKHKAYFQFIALDITQLNSEVIRVFKRRYCQDENPSIKEIVQDEVEFFAHVIIKFGLKLNFWSKVGNVSLEEHLTLPMFKGSDDYGEPNFKNKKSTNWYIWQVGHEHQYIGNLPKKMQEYDLGVIVTPPDIIDRLRFGEYRFVHPTHEGNAPVH